MIRVIRTICRVQRVRPSFCEGENDRLNKDAQRNIIDEKTKSERTSAWRHCATSSNFTMERGVKRREEASRQGAEEEV